MSVRIASSVARTCLGDDEETFAALLGGVCGVGELRYLPADRLNVRAAYHIERTGPEDSLRASRWLTECVAEAVARAGIDPARRRVVALIGTGLRQLRAVERWSAGGMGLRRDQLHFASAIRAAAPGVASAVTIANACSAGGYALALGQDLVEHAYADAVVVAAADAMTESMLAMIGRFSDEPTERVRPFDAGRTGVLLGEGAAAVVLVADDATAPPPVARLLATGLSCDAHHETAPDAAGVRRAVYDALRRAGRSAADVDVVFAHGTGTQLNDPTEAAVLRDVFGTDGRRPLVTAVKGAVGHTSGVSSLTSLAMAVHTLHRGIVPPVVGLCRPLPEGHGLNFVRDRPSERDAALVQINSFGFGGVNAVTLVAAP